MYLIEHGEIQSLCNKKNRRIFATIMFNFYFDNSLIAIIIIVKNLKNSLNYKSLLQLQIM
jgi:hypothetical protein